MEQIHDGAAAVTQVCDVEKPVTIVAVPVRARADHLSLAGVPTWAAKLMAGPNVGADQRCQILTMTEPQSGVLPGGKTICVVSTVVLREVLVLSGTEFNMTLVKQGQGSP